MPEKDNKRRPLESIKQWRNRILRRNTLGINGGELEPSAITVEGTPKPISVIDSAKNLIKGVWNGESKNWGEGYVSDILNIYDKLGPKAKTRALEVAMRASQGTGNPADAFTHYIFQGGLPTRDAGYILTGIGKPSLNLYGGYYNEDTGLPDVIRPDLIDAVLYGKEVNSGLGKQVIDNDYGILTNYKNRVFPNKSIQMIQTEPAGVKLPNQTGIISNGTLPGTFNGDFVTSYSTPSGYKYRLNNAGVSIEYGTRNDSTFVRGWDSFDFASPNGIGYKRQWGDRYNDTNRIIDIIHNATHPLFIRTPWVYYKDAESIGINTHDWTDKVNDKINDKIKK